jgi:hypothetical protein
MNKYLLVSIFLICSLCFGITEAITAFAAASSSIDSVIIGESPTKRELASIENKLADFISKHPAAFREPIKDISKYKIQYMVIHDKGHRLIFINGVCKDVWPNVKNGDKELVMVKDGGACFFNLKYDPQLDLFLDFMINGEA